MSNTTIKIKKMSYIYKAVFNLHVLFVLKKKPFMCYLNLEVGSSNSKTFYPFKKKDKLR